MGSAEFGTIRADDIEAYKWVELGRPMRRTSADSNTPRYVKPSS